MKIVIDCRNLSPQEKKNLKEYLSKFLDEYEIQFIKDVYKFTHEK